MIISISKRNGVFTINSPYGCGFRRYIGYSRREAIRRWRHEFGLRGRHVTFVGD